MIVQFLFEDRDERFDAFLAKGLEKVNLFTLIFLEQTLLTVQFLVLATDVDESLVGMLFAE